MPTISLLPTGVATSSTPFPAIVGGVTDQVTLAPVYTALDNKAALSHTHAESDVTNLVADLAALSASALITEGYSRLQVDSTTQISLQRNKGATIPVKTGSAWAAMSIPSSGVTLSSTTLSADTVYNLYAFNSSGAMTLLGATSAHAADATTGVEVMSTDATRTLVGKVWTSTGPHFLDNATDRRLINWFQRRGLPLANVFTTSPTGTSVTFDEIDSAIRYRFLTWADELVHASVGGTATTNVAGNATYTAIAFDSTSVPAVKNGFTNPAGAVNRGPMALSIATQLTEGSHYATLLYAVTGGNLEVTSSDNLGTGIIATKFYGAIRG